MLKWLAIYFMIYAIKSLTYWNEDNFVIIDNNYIVDIRNKHYAKACYCKKYVRILICKCNARRNVSSQRKMLKNIYKKTD